jgi:hypothetical protein
MKKIILMMAVFLFTACLLIADEQPTQSNPFDKFDKEIKKLDKEIKKSEERKAKSDDKLKKGFDSDIKRAKDQKDRALKKLTASLEKEKETLKADIDKAKDKNADSSAKQARLDYLDKMSQYYNDLSSGKTAELPKDPAKETAKDKTAVATDKAADKKTGDAEDK